MKSAPEMLVCSSFAARLKGLFAHRARRCSYIVLAPCRAIHTFGMERAIDVAFVDESGRVVKSVRSVARGSRLSCKKACMTVERMACDEPWYELGDMLFAKPRENERKAL